MCQKSFLRGVLKSFHFYIKNIFHPFSFMPYLFKENILQVTTVGLFQKNRKLINLLYGIIHEWCHLKRGYRSKTNCQTGSLKNAKTTKGIKGLVKRNIDSKSIRRRSYKKVKQRFSLYKGRGEKSLKGLFASMELLDFYSTQIPLITLFCFCTSTLYYSNGVKRNQVNLTNVLVAISKIMK